MALFRFDASIHAISTNSYVDDSRAFDTVSHLNASISVSWKVVRPRSTIFPIRSSTFCLYAQAHLSFSDPFMFGTCLSLQIFHIFRNSSEAMNLLLNMISLFSLAVLHSMFDPLFRKE